MAGLESNKTKTGGENAIHGKICKVRRNKCTVICRETTTVVECYQWPEKEKEGCWSGAERRATFTGAVRRLGDARRTMAWPRAGRRRRRRSADQRKVDRRAGASRERSESTGVLLELVRSSGDTWIGVLLTDVADQSRSSPEKMKKWRR